jgi:hypothetical protein
MTSDQALRGAAGGLRKRDDPRPGGDGGRRERLRGGRADPTQRSRGVQPPRACLNVPFET